MQKIPPLQFIVCKIPLTFFPMENRLVASGRGNVITVSVKLLLRVETFSRRCTVQHGRSRETF